MAKSAIHIRCGSPVQS